MALVDYGASNLHSVRRALEAAGAAVDRVDTPEGVARAERVLLPGVGAFGSAMADLREKGLDDAIVAFVASGRPLLGICAGMQVLFARGAERGDHAGLGLFSGTVARLPDGVSVPHMGWHPLTVLRESPLVPAPFTAYFAHSYFAPVGPEAVAMVTHGAAIAAVVSRDNLTGAQFHPEKSGAAGLAFLSRWVSS